jgi:hypothetical protein
LQKPIPAPQSPALLRHIPLMEHLAPEHGVPSPFGSSVGLAVGRVVGAELLPPRLSEDGRNMPASKAYSTSPPRYPLQAVLPVVGSALFSASGAMKFPFSSSAPFQTSLTCRHVFIRGRG